jgi:hypothetical protein
VRQAGDQPGVPPREQLCNRYCSNKHTRRAEPESLAGSESGWPPRPPRLRVRFCTESKSKFKFAHWHAPGSGGAVRRLFGHGCGSPGAGSLRDNSKPPLPSLNLRLGYNRLRVKMCVFITAGPIIKLCAGGEGDSEGHVL